MNAIERALREFLAARPQDVDIETRGFARGRDLVAAVAEWRALGPDP